MSEALKDMISLLEAFLSDKETHKFPMLSNALTICKVAKKKAESLPDECEFKDECKEVFESEDDKEPYNWRDDRD